AMECLRDPFVQSGPSLTAPAGVIPAKAQALFNSASCSTRRLEMPMHVRVPVHRTSPALSRRKSRSRRVPYRGNDGNDGELPGSPMTTPAALPRAGEEGALPRAPGEGP